MSEVDALSTPSHEAPAGIAVLSFTLPGETPQVNKTLQEYLSYPPFAHGNGKLEYNIANTYFQLEEYPFAILYYLKAKKLRPKDPAVDENLNLALEKLGLPKNQKNVFDFFPTLSQRLQGFFLFGILSFFLASLLLWRPELKLKKFLVATIIFSSICLFSALGSHYFSHVTGVVVRGTNLYRGAGTNFAKVVLEPIPGGSQFNILEVLENGEWVKIQTQKGLVGYVLSEKVREI
jgi:tetratricopeptide (TPR) repeat protein